MLEKETLRKKQKIANTPEEIQQSGQLPNRVALSLARPK